MSVLCEYKEAKQLSTTLFNNIVRYFLLTFTTVHVYHFIIAHYMIRKNIMQKEEELSFKQIELILKR